MVLGLRVSLIVCLSWAVNKGTYGSPLWIDFGWNHLEYNIFDWRDN